MTACPVCGATLPSSDSRSGSTRGREETVAGVRCHSCGLMIFPSADVETQAAESHAGLRAGSVIAHFKLVRPLGRGSFGEVWLTEDLSLNRLVALKLPAGGRFEANLLREAQSAAQLNHPNIVSVYEAGMAGGQEFIAVEYVEGQTLKDLNSYKKLTIDEAVTLVVTICGALAHAHEHKIVHRDVKPSNILINESLNPFVADFGLAKNIASDQTISSDGQVLGTAVYMSPEQASGRVSDTDARADVYAVGVILFELLTGHVPFRGTSQAVIHQKIHVDSPSPRTLVPKLARDLETICLRCLERDHTKRYESAADVAAELNRFQNSEPIEARPITKLERGWRWCQRRPLISGLAASTLLSLTVGLIGISYFYFIAEQRGDQARRSLYRAQMNLISTTLRNGDVTAVREQLDRIATNAEMASLRNFAWHHFDLRTSILSLLGNHGSPVGDLAISHDGQIVVSAGNRNGSRDVRVWDVASRRLHWKLTPASGRVLSVGCSPRQSQFVAGFSDGWVRIYQTDTRRPSLAEFKHGPAVTWVRFTPDGKKICSAGEFGAIRVWDTQTQEMLSEIPTGMGENVAIQLGPRSQTVGVMKSNGFWRLRSLNDPAKLADWKLDDTVQSFSFLGESDEVAFADIAAAATLEFRSIQTGKAVRHMPLASLAGDMAYVPGSDRLLVSEFAGSVTAIDPQVVGPLKVTDTHALSLGNLTVSADGRFAAVAGQDGGIRVARVFDLADREIFMHDKPVRAICPLVDSTDVVTATENGDLIRWDLSTGTATPFRTTTNAKLPKLAWNNRLRRLAVAGFSQSLEVWNMDSLRVTGSRVLPTEGVADLAWLADDRLLVAMRDGAVLLIAADGRTSETLVHARGEDIVISMDVCQNDDRVYLGNVDGFIRQYELSSGNKLASTTIDSTPVASLHCLPTAGKVAVGLGSGKLAMLDALSLKPLWEIKGHGGSINDVASIENDTTLVSASRDATLRLWDVASGELTTTLIGHRRQVFCLAVSDTVPQILSGELDGEMRAWTAELQTVNE